MILFGVSDSGVRLGLPASLASSFDPARITDQLRRKAPSAAIGTAYSEHAYYGKIYGVLVIMSIAVPIVFDTEWGFNTGTSHQLVIRPGVVYVRTPGRCAPARQADLREVWQRSLDAATRRTLARIERVVTLPPDVEIVASADLAGGHGYLLTSGSEGRPVRIVDDPLAPAIRLADAYSPQMPYSSLAGELASQVRHWQQADQAHRVSRQALMRWWLEREALELDDKSARFCLLSAAANHGYPMYWASAMSRTELALFLHEQLARASAVPCAVYPYVVGTFFWDERHDMLDPYLLRFSPAPQSAAQKVLQAHDRREFLCASRFNSRLRFGNEAISVAQLADNPRRLAEFLETLIQRDLDGAATDSERGFARQLDMLFHAPPQ